MRLMLKLKMRDKWGRRGEIEGEKAKEEVGVMGTPGDQKLRSR